MKILFGMKLDGARWTYEKSSVGTVVFGYMQMLEYLEQRLGLCGVFASEPERIGQYLKKIEEADPKWCRQSFALDSWSTAKQMLSWRDELVLNGWNKTDCKSERLETLASVEKSCGKLSLGVSDRLERVLERLCQADFSEEIKLYDGIDLLPYLWKQIFTALKVRGASVSDYEAFSLNNPKVTSITGENEFTLAKECVRFLSASDNHSTAIICEDNTSVLDGILHRAGFGRIGNPYKSKWRESLQILPLWIKTLWKPFDAQQFLELLMLPKSPIPWALRKNLSNAIQKHPGIGGEEWDKAWNNAVEDIKKFSKENAESTIKCAEEIWNLLNENSFFAQDMVSEIDITQRCNVLIKRLKPQANDNPELSIAISHAKTLKILVENRGQIGDAELDRMLDSIISTGTDGFAEEGECNDFCVYKNPGMILRDYDNIIWWNCTGSKMNSCTNWTKSEIDAMNGYSSSAARKIESSSWNNAPSHAVKNFICFIPKVLGGEEVFAHPILDEYGEDKINKLSESDLTDENGLWHLLERKIQLEEASPINPVISNRFDGDGVAPKTLSYTQLSCFISCPVKWILQYHIGLKQADEMNVPSGNQMIGTMAHKIVQNIYTNRQNLKEEEAARLAASEFDNLVPKMAAELLKKGNEVELQRNREVLVSSIKYLNREINKRGLMVSGSEVKYEKKFEGIDFIGFSDLVLKDKNGDEFVIDMKWSCRKDYEESYNNEEALQLAVYSWLIDKNKNINCAYYLFPKQKFIYKAGMDWESLILRAKETYRRRMSGLNNGVLTKGSSLNESDDDYLKIDSKCDFCDFCDFCNVLEGENE